MVCRWQTVEDGAPRDLPHKIPDGDVLLVAVPVRSPYTYAQMRTHLIVRAHATTGRITAACEPFEQAPDGD